MYCPGEPVHVRVRVDGTDTEMFPVAVAVMVFVPLPDAEPLKTVTPAAAAGVTALLAAVYAPVPKAFTAATRNTYAVPLVSPVMVALVAVDAAAAENVDQVAPLFELNCSR